MPNYTFDYYYLKRNLSIKEEGNLRNGYIYIGIRLDTLFMKHEDIRHNLGFLNKTEIVSADRGVTIDIEKTFHCAASKGLVGHLSFVLIPEDATQPVSVWGSRFSTSVSFKKALDINTIRDFLYGHSFIPPIPGTHYKVEAGSIREKKRRGE